MARLVTVMPSCAPESCVDSERSEASTLIARRSPSAAAESTAARLRDERELCGDEGAAGHDEQDGQQQEGDLHHRAPPSVRRGCALVYDSRCRRRSSSVSTITVRAQGLDLSDDLLQRVGEVSFAVIDL